jgi:hypothetical protein
MRTLVCSLLFVNATAYSMIGSETNAQTLAQLEGTGDAHVAPGGAGAFERITAQIAGTVRPTSRDRLAHQSHLAKHMRRR